MIARWDGQRWGPVGAGLDGFVNATYKMAPGAPAGTRIEARYGAADAARVVEAALADYADAFPAADADVPA